MGEVNHPTINFKDPPYSTSHGRVYSEMEDYMGLQRIPWHFSLRIIVV